jgi:membrane protein
LHLQQIQDVEPCITDDMLQRMLSALDSLNIVQRAEKGSWLLSRDLDQVSLIELYENLHLRVPAAELVLPCHDDAIGQAAARAMEQLRQPLLPPLQLSVGSFLRQQKE